MTKLLFIATVATLLVSIPVHSSVITTNNGKIYCDGIVCPDSSVSCIISKKTSDDLKVYIYSRTCLDASGTVTQKTEEELTNPHPGTIINSISQVGGTMTEEDKERLDSIVKGQEQYWTQWTSDFNNNMKQTMEKAFPPGFPFN